MSRFLAEGAPSTCAFCNQPFPQIENHDEAYRGHDNRYYCTAICARVADPAPIVPRLRAVS